MGIHDETATPSEPDRQALKAVVNFIRLSEPLVFELWRSHELTLAQVQCLRFLSQQKEQAGDLAKKLSMSSTSLTRVIERLESRGMIVRSVDLHDRRRIWVELTAEGQKAVSSLTSWYTSPLFQAIQSMPSEAKEELTRILKDFTERVHHADPEFLPPRSSLSEDVR